MGAEKFFDIKCRASGSEPGCGRRGRHGPGAQDARRGRQDRGRQAARPGAARGERRGGPARRRRTSRSRSRTSRCSGSPRSSPSTRSRPTRRPRSRRSARSPWRPARATRSSPPTSSTAARARPTSPRRSGRRARTGRAEFRAALPGRDAAGAKIETIATRVYGADGVEFLPAARKSLQQFEDLGYGHLPICMAKTQYSLSHDASLKNRPTGFTVPDPRGPPVGRAPGSSRRCAGRCGRCRGCPRVRAARTSTSTPTGTSSACSSGQRIGSAGSRRRRATNDQPGHDAEERDAESPDRAPAVGQRRGRSDSAGRRRTRARDP